MNVWPDGQVREEEPYRCGCFVAASGEQCTKLSDHDGPHLFDSDAFTDEERGRLDRVRELIDSILPSWTDSKYTSVPVGDLRLLSRAARSALWHNPPVGEIGAWRRCTPGLLKAGVDCGGCPRRVSANGVSHDHWVVVRYAPRA